MTSTRELAGLFQLGAGIVLLAVAGCSDDGSLGRKTIGSELTPFGQGSGSGGNQTRIQTFWGQPAHLGDGLVRTYVMIDAQGTPVSIGVMMTEKALQDLPETSQALVLTLPKKAEDLTQYTHVLLDWNPQGHPPPGTYDVPHFDFHFYMTSIEEREAITATDVAGFALAPPLQYIPGNYVQFPGGEAQMGTHWGDMLAPEFTGGTFSRTFIWGTFNGQVTFFEPMITLAYLESMPDETIQLRQPAAFQTTGYYPTSYSVMTRDHPASILISLDGLMYQQAQ